MFAKLLICLALVGACACQTTGSTQQTSGGMRWGSANQGNTTLSSWVTPASSSNNQSANATATIDWANQAPVTQFFGQVLRGEVFGLRKCKKPKDCGLGLRCDILLNLCVPFNTPILSDIEKPCSNDSECSGMHACQAGLCRFCGPKSCRTSMDCCAGSFAQPGKPGSFYECLNTEDQDKLSIARQLGRVPPNYQPMPKVAGGKSLDEAFEVESEELIQLGLPAVMENPFHGKRCWARCNVDTDCHTESTPAGVKQSLGCCNNVCTKKSACTILSPQQVQQAQQLQQQRLQQQQVWNQQQAVVQQQQQAQKQQSMWGAGSGMQQPAQQQQWGQPQPQPQQVQFQFAVPVQQAAAPPKPVPASWQEAQQQGPNQWNRAF